MLQHESFENLLEKQNQNTANDDLVMLLLRSLYQTLQLRRVPDLSCSELTLALTSIINRLLTGRLNWSSVLLLFITKRVPLKHTHPLRVKSKC